MDLVTTTVDLGGAKMHLVTATIDLESVNLPAGSQKSLRSFASNSFAPG